MLEQRLCAVSENFSVVRRHQSQSESSLQCPASSFGLTLLHADDDGTEKREALVCNKKTAVRNKRRE